MTEFVRFVVTLAAVVDPFLAVPFFLTFTADRDGAARRRLARLVAITVFIVLACATFAGEPVLRAIGASLSAVQVGGGLVLLLMSLAMLNAQAGGVRQSKDEAQEFEQGDVSGIVPLAFPLLAGPGAISTSIIAARDADLVHQLGIVTGIAIVCVLSWIVLLNANAIAKRMSMTAMNIATRILGLLLAAMAVQTMAGGLKELFPGLAS